MAQPGFTIRIMSLTDEQQASIEADAARVRDIGTRQALRTNALHQIRKSWARPAGASEAGHLKALAIALDKALTRYEKREEDQTVGLYASLAEVFKQTAARLAALQSATELAT